MSEGQAAAPTEHAHSTPGSEDAPELVKEEPGIETAHPAAPVPEPESEPHAPRHLWAVAMVFDIAVDLPTPHALITLREVAEPHRLFAFPAALADASALAHAWRGVATPRPLTHDLVSEMLVRLGATIEVVRLLGRREGVILAELELSSARSREVVSCRPTDGLTLAIAQGVPAPILIDQRLFDPEGDVDPLGGAVS